MLEPVTLNSALSPTFPTAGADSHLSSLILSACALVTEGERSDATNNHNT